MALIHQAFSQQSAQTDPPSGALRETTDTIAKAIVTGGGACAIETGEMLGVILWQETEAGLYFGRLAVRPDRRGHGIARTLIAAAEAEAHRRGLKRVHLSTRLTLLDNRRLFTSCGYRETELRAHAGYAAPTSIVMEKRAQE